MGDKSHICIYEQGSISQVAGVHPRQLRNRPDGTIALEDIRAAIRPVALPGHLEACHPLDDHFPVTRVICLENTHNKCGGRVLPLAYMAEVHALAQEHGVKVHLDGARVMNACVALSASPAELAAHADSVTMCLSKALGAPVGSVVVGDRAFINRARRARKVLGGALRQAGVLAAPALLALREMANHLPQDHANARALAVGLNRLPGFAVDLDAVESNMVYADLAEPVAAEVVRALERRGILIGSIDERQVRAATHHQVSPEHLARALAAFAACAGELFGGGAAQAEEDRAAKAAA